MTTEAAIALLTTNSLAPDAFAKELSEQHFKIRDFVADPRDIRTFTDKDGTVLMIRGQGKASEADAGEFMEDAFNMLPWAHQQLGEFCGIPGEYYKRMQASQHGLLDTSVRTWLDASGGKPRMVRTLDGRVRAFLSDRYQRIDNYHLANMALPVLLEAGATFRRLHVTEDEMVIQAVFMEKKADVKVGDTVMLGITITGNEVGKGAVAIDPMSLTLNCLNGMTHNELGHRRQHLGTKLGNGGDPREFFAEDTIRADDQATLLKLRDMVRKASDDVMLTSIVTKFQRALEIPITTAPAFAVKELEQRAELTEAEGAGILGHLLTGGSLTQWGMAQAITRHAQDIQDALRAHELENIGGNILDMARSEFGPIAQAGEPTARPRRRSR